MPTSKVTSIMADLETALAAITGVQKVWKVGSFTADLVGRLDGADFPVILLKAKSRNPADQYHGANRLMQSTLEVAILALDNGRTESDDTWGADRAEELERLVDAAVLADRTRGGHAWDTVPTGTTYNPDNFGAIDAAVGMTFQIKHRVRYGDLSSSAA